MPSASGHDPNFRHALRDHKAIGSAVAFCLSIIVIWPVSALLAYHARLLLLDATTIEMPSTQVDPGRDEAAESVLARAHEVTTEDLREVNPGMRAGGRRGRGS
ncbi:hypothetical protein H0H92_005465 [Tricholoma furcatifolium]|nr:hypothetical protein H0H92_005465 [Tricholoma furcatifolium]